MYSHRVNGNAAIDGRGERNRKRLRSTELIHGVSQKTNPCLNNFVNFIPDQRPSHSGAQKWGQW